MKTEIPDFLIEMSNRMNADENRCTSHPFWQVRCKRYLVTAEGYSEHHWELIDSESGVIFRSDKDSIRNLAEFMKHNFTDYFNDVVEDYRNNFDEFIEDSDIDEFVSAFDIDHECLPEGLDRVFVQEIEDIVWTGMTKSGALAFIKRKQHDYPELYTYVESAYWSPELRQLQDWIKSLTIGQ